MLTRLPLPVFPLMLIAFCITSSNQLAADDLWTTYEGRPGGKKIVLVTGDDEYRSEESMPQLAKILSKHHGFNCVVLYAMDPASGEIVPSYQQNIPGLEQLDDADLMVMFLRFRDLPPDQMKHILDYVESGRPIVALRTSTHPFSFRTHKNEQTELLNWDCQKPGHEGGFGRQVLGETWVSHYGGHQSESTRGLPADGQEGHPILRGVSDIWGPSDVYEIASLTGDSQPVVMGQVLTGMNKNDSPKQGMKLMPLAWVKSHTTASGKRSRIFTTTLGHAEDFENEGVRRLLVNACYWGMGLENEIPANSTVELVGDYDPTPIGFDKFKRGVKPADHKMAH